MTRRKPKPPSKPSDYEHTWRELRAELALRKELLKLKAEVEKAWIKLAGRRR